jgi:nucleotide-binding universal stress UspA family protein
VHPLAHPGLRFLVLPDGSPEAAAAVRLGEELARSIHARVTILEAGERRELGPGAIATGNAAGAAEAGQVLAASAGNVVPFRATDGIGSARRDSYDVVVVGLPARLRGREASRLLAAGDHHLLIVPAGAALPTRFLICVAVGEPGKEDVLFASRLLRQLGAQATVLTVLPERGSDDAVPEHISRFLERSATALAGAGSNASTRVRRGPPLREILAEVEEGGHDLLVVGAPLPDSSGRASLEGLVADLLGAPPPCPVLIVRARRDV